MVTSQILRDTKNTKFFKITKNVRSNKCKRIKTIRDDVEKNKNEENKNEEIKNEENKNEENKKLYIFI